MLNRIALALSLPRRAFAGTARITSRTGPGPRATGRPRSRRDRHQPRPNRRRARPRTCADHDRQFPATTSTPTVSTARPSTARCTDGRRRPDPGRRAQRCAQALSADRARADVARPAVKNVAGAISMAQHAARQRPGRLLHPAQRHARFRRRKQSGGDPNGFAAFGRVTEGMDVVKKIFGSPDVCRPRAKAR